MRSRAAGRAVRSMTDQELRTARTDEFGHWTRRIEFWQSEGPRELLHAVDYEKEEASELAAEELERREEGAEAVADGGATSYVSIGGHVVPSWSVVVGVLVLLALANRGEDE